ncbi:acyl-CoA dehydrogenase family protein [Myxococcus sp. RHSTA-1-4]|uniref:acyl-CoA dehydrogenase family protein n=1 Tax=Myxococcus sp. RHSTA-1-4 TaxID=2874601 RepID=UPI001CBDB3F2|nr:acyl-CoA dehydrogenase family protein [Myxococcus sp. RHSTA-1-4]MBZ4415393.1 acyl-CoA dehydrogenase family protein [Myxococcus sp. RHSTA-1-4]
MTLDAGAKLLQAVRELAPTLTARSAEIEKAGELPEDLVALLKDLGCYRMFVPRSHGGLELDLVTGLEVLAELARADASTGWTMMITSESPQLFSLLPREEFDALYANGPDITGGGAFNAQGLAMQVDGGYRVTGRWNFASNCRRTDWLFGNCVVLGPDGQPRPGPVEGLPETRAMVVPARDVRIEEHWDVLGMRGTGSHDILIDTFVPQQRTFDIFTGQPAVPGPCYMVPVLHYALHIGAVAAGIAQGAVDDLLVLARSGKRRLYARTSLIDSPVFRNRLGRAETGARAAHDTLRRMGEVFWEACKHSPQAAFAMAPQVSATLAWVAETAAEVVTACYHAGGGTTVRDGTSLQRRFRDIHTLTQHAAVAEGWFTQEGSALLGFPVLFEA